MSLLENMKDIADLIKKAGDVELYRRIVESEGEVVDLTREKRQLEDRVRELESQLALQKKMAFKSPFYWQEGDATPYCPTCWETKQMAVHLAFAFEDSNGARWDCKSCQQRHTDRKGRHSPPAGRVGPSGPNSWMR